MTVSTLTYIAVIAFLVAQRNSSSKGQFHLVQALWRKLCSAYFGKISWDRSQNTTLASAQQSINFGLSPDFGWQDSDFGFCQQILLCYQFSVCTEVSTPFTWFRHPIHLVIHGIVPVNAKNTNAAAHAAALAITTLSYLPLLPYFTINKFDYILMPHIFYR